MNEDRGYEFNESESTSKQSADVFMRLYIYENVQNRSLRLWTSVLIPDQPGNIFLSCRNTNTQNLSENKSFQGEVHKK